jgi:hypothetical protein
VFVPLAMREKIRRIDERIRAVGLAVEWFERDQHKTLQKRAKAWVAEWQALARATQDSVIQRWQRGELTTGQAIAAMDEEMRRNAPRLWSILGR